MSAPKMLPTMREPAAIALDFAEKVIRDEGTDGRATLDVVTLGGFLGIAFSLRDEQWSPEVERLRAEVQRLTAERDEAEARHENELRTRLDHVGAMDDENTKIILENDALKAQVLDGHGCPPEHKDPNDDYVDGYYVVCAKCFDALAAEGESRDHAE